MGIEDARLPRLPFGKASGFMSTRPQLRRRLRAGIAPASLSSSLPREGAQRPGRPIAALHQKQALNDLMNARGLATIDGHGATGECTPQRHCFVRAPRCK